MLFLRLGSRSIRSDAELEEISNNLKEYEASQQQKKLLAIDAPQLLSTYDRRLRFINTNGLIRDVEQFEIVRKTAIIWTEEEKRIFREKYNQSPKDFGRIAAALERKSCSDCVLFYYQNKKKEGFRTTKTKKKKGKVPAKGSIKTDQSKGGKGAAQSNILKPGETNFDVEEFEYIDEDEDDDGDDDAVMAENEGGEGTENMALGEVDITKSSNDKIDVATSKEVADSGYSLRNQVSALPGMEVDEDVDKKPQPVQTRSKLKSAAAAAAAGATDKPHQQQESGSDAATEPEYTSDEGEGGDHPPLRMKIVVTSPSTVKEKTLPLQTASIVSETITQTSYFGEAPPDHPANSPLVEVALTEPSSEDLIRQHLNKMPGISLKVVFFTI